jgi:hypothetical protein
MLASEHANMMVRKLRPVIDHLRSVSVLKIALQAGRIEKQPL